MSSENPLPEESCIEYGDGDCGGPVEYRDPLSSTGRSFPRCADHWEERLDRQQEILRRYGGDAPPADFDPTFCGERWDEDD
jgi:hypothetical protein